ncbi:MAG: heme-binding protein [Planctomycetota bacterium]
MRMRILMFALTALAACGIGYAEGEAKPRMEPSASVAAMLADLPTAAAKLPPQSPVRQAVEAGDLDRARAMLGFRPLAEAPLPEGFPAFTPVGVIEVKKYPAYRKASGPGFWPLFQHIKAENIPMTAPVEMTRAGRNGQRPMAFLYQNTSVGKTGDAGGVVVADAEPTMAVSLGIRGRMSQASTIDAKKRLDGWLADHPEYRRATMTPFRLFGYSSPMVPDADKYWEAQVLIEPTQGTTTEAAQATRSP